VAAFGALVYSTGFLIQFTFFSSMNAKGAVNDLLKAKYIHAGFLFLQFPASLIAVVLGFSIIKKRLRALKAGTVPTGAPPPDASIDLAKVKSYIESTLLFGTLLIGFYVLIAFARRGLFAEHQWLVILFFVVILVGTTAVRELEMIIKFSDPENMRKFGRGARWTCLLAAWVIGGFLFYPETIGVLVTMFGEGGYLCYGFLGLIGYLLHRMRKWSVEVPDPVMRYGLLTVGVATCGALYYMSVLSFAYRVYPFIPVVKGGGDYTDERAIILTFDERQANSVPEALVQRAAPATDQLAPANPMKLVLTSQPVILIEETPTALFVASPKGSVDPVQWRNPAPDKKPTVICVQRSLITSTAMTR
jgi:hypothetical protein